MSDQNDPQSMNVLQSGNIDKDHSGTARKDHTRASQDSEVMIIQERLKKNKVIFFGYPLLVVTYVFVVVILLVYPTVIKYFDYRDRIAILDTNYNNLKQTSANLQELARREQDIQKYENRLLKIVPSDSRLASLIDKIDQTAKGYSLEQQVSFNIQDERETINRLGSLGADVNYEEFIDSLNSGEIKFSPTFLQNKNVEARVLIVSIRIKGTKTNFIKFVDALQKFEPLVNVVSASYRENPDYSGNTQVDVDLNLESFVLFVKPHESRSDVKTLRTDEPELLTFMTVDSPEINSNLIKEFGQD
jgi:Tfp pilus assembly protein PilO